MESEKESKVLFGLFCLEKTLASIEDLLYLFLERY